MAYHGSTDLLSGIRPINGNTFPLVNARDVYVDDDTRLDTAIGAVKDVQTITVFRRRYIDYQRGATKEDIAEREGYINDSTGEFVAYPNSWYYVTDFVDVTGKKIVKLFYNMMDHNLNPLYYYDSARNFVGKYERADFGQDRNKVEYRIDVPDGVTYVRASFVGNSSEEFVLSYDDGKLYVNERPKYSYSEYMNSPLLPGYADIFGRIDDTTGAFVHDATDNYYSTDYISTDGKTAAHVHYSYIYGGFNPLYYYDTDRNFVGKYERETPNQPASDVTYDITLPAGTAYVRATMFGKESTDFSIAFDSEAAYQQGPTPPGHSNIFGYITDRDVYESETKIYDEGDFIPYPSNLYRFFTTDYIDITDMDVCRLHYGYINWNFAPVYYYDANKHYIGQHKRSDYGDLQDVDYRIVLNKRAKYIRMSMLGDEQNYGNYFTLYMDNGLEYMNDTMFEYIAFGDSITNGIGASGDLGSYVRRLNGMFDFGYCLNAGVGGQCVIQQRQNWEKSVLYNGETNGDGVVTRPGTKHISGFDGLITVAIGTNDYGFDSLLGTDQQIEAVIAAEFEDLTAPGGYSNTYTFAEGFRYTMEDLQRRNPEAKIICLLPVNRCDDDPNFLRYRYFVGDNSEDPAVRRIDDAGLNDKTHNYSGKTLDDFRECERRICKALGIQVIDMQECGVPMSNTAQYYQVIDGQPDGLHPNDHGQYMMTRHLIPTVQAALEGLKYYYSETV